MTGPGTANRVEIRDPKLRISRRRLIRAIGSLRSGRGNSPVVVVGLRASQTALRSSIGRAVETGGDLLLAFSLEVEGLPDPLRRNLDGVGLLAVPRETVLRIATTDVVEVALAGLPAARLEIEPSRWAHCVVEALGAVLPGGS